MSPAWAVAAAEIPACTIILSGIAGWVWRSGREHRLTQDRALAKHSEALAVLVAEFTPYKRDVEANVARLSRLESTTAELAAVLAIYTGMDGQRRPEGIRPAPHRPGS